MSIKQKVISDYEVFEVSSDDDAAVDDGEDEVLPSGAIRKRKILVEKEYKPSPVLPVPGGKSIIYRQAVSCLMHLQTNKHNYYAMFFN